MDKVLKHSLVLHVRGPLCQTVNRGKDVVLSLWEEKIPMGNINEMALLSRKVE